MNSRVWMIRASGRSARQSAFLDHHHVALGAGRAFRGIPEYEDCEQLADALRRMHPSWRPGRYRAGAAQLHCFLREIALGDTILTWDAPRRVFLVGSIRSEARWEQDATAELPFVRSASWHSFVDPDDLTADTRGALNVIQTLFAVGDGVAEEVLSVARSIEALPDPIRSGEAPAAAPSPLTTGAVWTAPATDAGIADLEVEHTPIPGSLRAVRVPSGPAAAPAVVVAVVEAEDEPGTTALGSGPTLAPEPEPEPERAAEPAPRPSITLPTPPAPARRPPAPSPSTLAEHARRTLQARLTSLSADALRSVLAGVLMARGYPRRALDPSTGADLFTGADLLGRAEPPVRAFVVPAEEPVSGDDVRALLADRDPSERWILLSTHGFDQSAKDMLDRSREVPRCTLLDSQDLSRLVLRHYDDLDLATRAFVPMVRVWWPAWEPS